jgi:hypothetical protein|tara:strand:+ start:112 stop:609 length:498 start_codon:yes stop_codon:yes gene_type:complete
MKIIKNFLPQETYQNIKQVIFSDNFPWFYNEEVLAPEDQIGQLSIFQFTHNFYKKKEPWSNHYKLLEPILDILKPTSLIRIKANLNTQTNKIIETGLHIDNKDARLKSAVFFLNNCDGYCRIGNEKILSEDNKMVIFNSNINHTGSTTTNKKRRVLINFIYLPSI